MRTTVNLPDDLVQNVMDLSGARTRTEAITAALSDYARRLRRENLKELRGQDPIEEDFDVVSLRESEQEEYEVSD